MTDGSSANRSGDRAEKVIRCILHEQGYRYKVHFPLCKSVYGHTIRTDILIENIPGYPNGIAIECKWQDCGGSVDEKFPYTVLNIKEQFPCPAIIVVDGGGQKPGSIEWLRGQRDGEKLLHVFDIAEFISWVNREMPAPIAGGA